jgi:hypothetical protein
MLQAGVQEMSEPAMQIPSREATAYLFNKNKEIIKHSPFPY